MSWVSGASQKGRDIGAAEAAGAPETGGKEDSVERKRLFHRGAVHPGAGAKPGLNQRRRSRPPKGGIGQPFGDFGVIGGLAGAN